MIAEIGKQYHRRDKKVSGTIQVNPGNKVYKFYDPKYNRSYTESGACLGEKIRDKNDLMCEYEENKQ